MLLAPVLEDTSTGAPSTSASGTGALAPVLLAPVLQHHKILNLKAFTLFCRQFENVVNRAVLVLTFLGKKLVGADFYAFCNYGFSFALGSQPFHSNIFICIIYLNIFSFIHSLFLLNSLVQLVCFQSPQAQLL